MLESTNACVKIYPLILVESRMYIWVQVFWNNLNHIDHITATVVWWLVCSLDRRSWVRTQVGSNQDYEIGTGICCFSAKHATLGSKSRSWLARNQDNVSDWINMSTRR
jgi:hypothetical protein